MPEVRHLRKLVPLVLLLACLSGRALADDVIVLNSGDASMSLIDEATRRPVRTVDLGKEPHHLMLTPDGRSLIVANAVGNSLVYLDPASGRIQRWLRGIEDPYQIGFSPDGRWFVTTCLRMNRIDIYRFSADQPHLVARLPVRSIPSHMAFTRDSRIVFVTLQGSNELAAIDLPHQKLLWRMHVGEAPAGLWLTPGDKLLLVALTGSNAVVALDWRTRRVVKRIVTGAGAHNFRSLDDGRHVLVSNRVASTISVLDERALDVTGTIKGLLPGPDDMELSRNRRYLWVTFRWARHVGVIDLRTRRLLRTIHVGRSPHGIFFADRAPWFG